MTTTADKVCILAAWVAASAIALSFATPAMAEENGRLHTMMKVLDSADAQVRADMMELQQLKIALPLGAEAYHAAAVREHALARDALGSGNLDFARDHAMKAMNFFKSASDMFGDVEILKEPSALGDDEIEIQEQRAGYLRNLATANNITVSFADYDLAIRASSTALVKHDLEKAKEQLARVESRLDDIQNRIQTFADSRKEEKVQAFSQKMKEHLSRIIIKAEKDSTMTGRDTLMQEAKNAIHQLENAANVDEIIKITEDSSRIQDVLREYEDVLSDSNEESQEEVSEPEDNSGDEKDDSTANDGAHEESGNSGSGNDESDDSDGEVEQLRKLADNLEERANRLLDESDNLVATLKIQAALELIAIARIDIDEGHYDAAAIALSTAEADLDIAEELLG